MLRLTTDYGYRDVYENGLGITDADWGQTPIPLRSIIVYRYYEASSTLLGAGAPQTMEDFAKGLSKLILRIRDLVCADPNNKVTLGQFRCYLVAHSMCRAFLQNPALGEDQARRCVDKVFTYATLHNGIDMGGENIPKWLTVMGMDNFNRERMAEYFNLKDSAIYKDAEGPKRVDWLPEEFFPSDRFFCMVGTNRADYEVAMGLSRTFSGHASDGLVRIDNASVSGIDAKGQPSAPCAKAYAYRSHSGYFGIINSEEAYQNLKRFLFGDIRVDIWVDVETVQLPSELQGKPVNALYLFELEASPRGMRWYLTRRKAEEDSVACRSHKELTAPENKSSRSIFLSSVFLDKIARIDPNRPSLAYGLTFGVRVPDYEVERGFWPDSHFEGAYLYRDGMIVEMTPRQSDGEVWDIAFDWQSDNLGRATKPLASAALKGGKTEMTVAFDRKVPRASLGNCGSWFPRGMFELTALD